MDVNIIAFVNQKGGVGKTTSCINAGAALSLKKHRVLIIDLDPQGNATMGCGIDKNSVAGNINDVLLGRNSLESAIIRSPNIDIDVLSSNSDLTESEVALLRYSNREKKLKNLLKPIYKKYDYILIDCPPSLNMLTLNALVAANFLVVPLQCEYYAMEGLSSLLNTVIQLQNSLNKDLRILGILRTMYDVRNKLCTAVSEQLLSNIEKTAIFKTIIPKNIRLAEAPSHGMSIFNYDILSKGAEAYRELGREIVKKCNKPGAIKQEVLRMSKSKNKKIKKEEVV